MSVSTAMNEGYPSQYESWTTLKNGKKVFLRPVLETDGDLLTGLFNKLSPRSIYLRFLNPLRSLPEDLLYSLTHVDYGREFALVALIGEDGKDCIIAVGRYGFNPEDNVTDLAVVVRDDWQNLGLGKTLLSRTISIGKEHGISRFVSVINPQNYFIKRTLEKLGYELRYSSRGGVTQAEMFV